MSRPPKPVRYEKKPMRDRTGPPSRFEGPSRRESLPKPCWTEIAAKRPSQLFLNLVQPLTVRLDDPLRQSPVDGQGLGPARKLRLALLAGAHRLVELVELGARRSERSEQFPPIGV